MAGSHFLVRNRHNNVWYVRIIIPGALKVQFNNKREFRRSLKTTNKQKAKKLSLAFWVACQRGFDQLINHQKSKKSFAEITEFLQWMQKQAKLDNHRLKIRDHNMVIKKDELEELADKHLCHYIKTVDVFGQEHIFDLNNHDDEMELMKAVHANANKLFEQYKDDPDTLMRILEIYNKAVPSQKIPSPKAETPMRFKEAVDLYIEKLALQGRKGRQLATRTIDGYKSRLEFWAVAFNNNMMHQITLNDLAVAQNWLTRLPVNFTKRGLTIGQAINKAKDPKSQHTSISDKTRSEYLAQLKGILEYAHSCGFISMDLASKVEIPNTKQSKAIERLPFSTDDLQKIFPGENYGADFGVHRTGVDKDCKFWFPLLAVFSGARLEEIAQLKTSDIKTDPDSGIIYMNITDTGMAADGVKKKTKNKNSVRPIPLHDTLIEIGFLRYVGQRRKDKSDKGLFKLKRDKQGRLAKGVSNWFSRMDKRKNGYVSLGYIEKIGVLSKGQNEAGERWSKSFHSFRHTVIDNLRGKQMSNGEFIREPDIGLVVGHEKGNLETANYGQNRLQLEFRKSIIDKIEYQCLTFDEVRWRN